MEEREEAIIGGDEVGGENTTTDKLVGELAVIPNGEHVGTGWRRHQNGRRHFRSGGDGAVDVGDFSIMVDPRYADGKATVDQPVVGG